jgi:hypothetical protein
MFLLPGRFEESLEAFHHFGAVAFAFGGGNLSFQALNGVRIGGSQCLFNFFPNRAEFFGSDHNNASNTSHNWPDCSGLFGSTIYDTPLFSSPVVSLPFLPNPITLV